MNQNFSTPSSSSFNNITALSSIKRSDRNPHLSNLNFKMLHMKDLTQELLDAENEPIIKEVPLVEEEESTDEPDVATVKEAATIKMAHSIDSGVACLDTPLKTKHLFKIPQSGKKIFSSTPLKTDSSFKIEQNNKRTPKIETQKEDLIIPIIRIVPDVEKFVINNVSYRVLKQLGKGGSAIVYHCLDVKDSEKAVKVINLNTDTNTIVGYQNEVKLLKQLQNCSRIIKMYDYEYVEAEKKLFVVLEKGGSDVAKILRNTKTMKRMPIHMIVFYWMEMLYAVQEIHKHGIVHADLKPSNFLQLGCGLKLIDFGIACHMKEDETSIARNIPVGSFNYISPEALRNESSRNIESPSYGKPKYKIKYKSDVWSLGCIFYQLIFGDTPFGHIQNVWAKLSLIMDPNHKIEYPTQEWVPKKFIGTIKRCLQYNVKERPSVDELIKEYEDVYM